MIVRLDPSHYLNPLGPVTGGASFSHMAHVDFGGHVAEAYVKLDDPRSGALFNEALGFFCARLLGIAAPEHAAILEIEPHRLAGLPGVPGWVLAAQEPLLAWATEDMAAKSVAQLHRMTGEGDTLWMKLLSSPLGPQLSAFDEFLANADRNAGNVLHLSASKFAAIDHGQLLGGAFWPITGCLCPSEGDLLKIGRALLPPDKLARFLQTMHLAAGKHPEG